MKIAIISDIHDNVWKLDAALQAIRAQKAEALICCGDLCSPFIVDLLMQDKTGFPGPIHIVFGNNDGDRSAIIRKAEGSNGQVQVHGEFVELVVVESETRLVERSALKREHHNTDVYFDRSIGDQRISVNHYDYLARPIAASGKYDIVFYGHNHRHRYERGDNFVAINPGAIMGYYGPTLEDIPSTFVIYDTGNEQESGWYEIVADVVDNGVIKYKVCKNKQVTVETFNL